MAKRFTAKKLEAVISEANNQGITAPHEGKFEVNSAYGNYRVVSRMPDTGCADVSGCHRGTARECAMEFLEYLRTREDVSVAQYSAVVGVYVALA